MDWKREIGIAFLVRQRVHEADREQLWPFHLPATAATESQIEEASRALGEELDASYAAFLTCANGWKAFFQTIDLFGTDQLLGGDEHDRGVALKASLSPLEPACGLSENELMVIGASAVDIDVFLIARTTSRSPGRVFWFAGSLIQEFPDFSEFFLAMVDYNREEVRASQQQPQ